MICELMDRREALDAVNIGDEGILAWVRMSSLKA